ncbi:MAG: thiol-disulfide oxidoreductase DCC family protein [Gemmataceae bacterium]
MNTPTLTIFFDGLCPLCSREISHYQGRTQGDPTVQYVDIAAEDFRAEDHGLDPRRVHEVMHVKLGDEIRTEVQAFIAIWDRVRGYAFLGRLARLPVIYPFLWLFYQLFARIRPWLPRKKASCETGTCRR